MSTEHYDLAARLRAASTGHVVARSTYAPLLPGRRAVAAEVHTGPGGALTLTVTERVTDTPTTTATTATATTAMTSGTAVRTATGHGPDALSALAALGIGDTIDLSAYTAGSGTSGGAAVRTSPTTSSAGASEQDVSEPFRTLVVADAATLRRLQRVLTATVRGGRWDAQASVLAWWLQRAEHPGSAAVLNVVAACAARWYPGAAPAADRHLDTWRQWLGIPACADPSIDHGTALLTLADVAAAGPALPGLEAAAEADERSWAYHLTRLSGGWDFRRHDTRTEAALGLATRCDATELFASQVLDDPLVADRARFEGSVVTGRISWLLDGEAEVVADRLVCRLRVDAVVEGWATPAAVATAAASEGLGEGLGEDTLPMDGGEVGASATCAAGTLQGTALRATVTGTRMSSAGELVLTLTDLRVAGARGRETGTQLAVGQNVHLRAERVSSAQQSRSRRNRRGRYNHSENFMLRPGAPSATRRDVPWDVVMAAATD